MQWIILVTMCLLAIWESMPLTVSAARLADIYWNSSNPMFRIDNTDHIIDVNKGNIPFEYDQVNIICPAYNPGTKEEDRERYIIYNVSKEEYDSCRITNPNARIIAICDKPQKMLYFTITFRSFTPQPGGLEFIPGQDYYFISTSGIGEGKAALDQRIGGRCATHNMKVIFKICCKPSKPSTESSTTTTTTIATTSTTSTTMSPTFIYRFNRPTMPPYWLPPSINTSKHPSMKTYDYPREEERGKMPSKKTEDRDKLPNETRAKNEELVNNQAASLRLQQNFITTLFLLLSMYQLLAR